MHTILFPGYWMDRPVLAKKQGFLDAIPKGIELNVDSTLGLKITHGEDIPALFAEGAGLGSASALRD